MVRTIFSMRNMRKCYIMCSIMVSLVMMYLFSGCRGVYLSNNFRFEYPNTTLLNRKVPEPSISLLKSGDNDHFFAVNFKIDTVPQIQGFELISGFIQIGDHVCMLNKSEVSISVDVNRMWNTVYWVIKGEEYRSQFNEPISIENETGEPFIRYFFSISKSAITDEEIQSILNEYQKKNRKTMLYLHYNITINNALIVKEISQEYVIEVEKLINY